MNALVIAGGQWQVALILFLKEKGYIVYVVDPYDDSLGVLAGDKHIKADVRDVYFIFEQIKDIDFEIITTDQSDISVDTVAYLAQKLGLKGNPVETVQKFSNKYLSREYSKKHGIPIPAYTTARTSEDVERFIATHQFPVIIKPCDSQSSKGIHKIEQFNLNEACGFIKDALKYSRLEYCLVEEFVSGVEFTVEGYCSSGKHRTLAISRKSHFRTGIASDLLYPAELRKDIEKALVEANDKYVENSGLNFGITHAEYMIDEKTGKFYLIEIACRGGGTLISSHIIKWVSGFDVYEALYADLAELGYVDVKGVNLLNRNAVLHFFEFPEGKVKRIKGIRDIKKMDGVLEINLSFSEGDTLRKAADDRERQGFVILLTDSKEKQKAKLDIINRTLEIEYA